MPDAEGSLEAAIEHYRVHFDAIYVAGIPNLLNDSGAFLSFIAVLTATDALAGLYSPREGSGERFKAFVSRFFPPPLAVEAEDLWHFRNAMVHSFNPGPFALTHHNSRTHLSTVHGPKLLNAEDFYTALIFAYQGYFSALSQEAELRDRFVKRVSARDGGAPETFVVSKPIG